MTTGLQVEGAPAAAAVEVEKEPPPEEPVGWSLQSSRSFLVDLKEFIDGSTEIRAAVEAARSGSAPPESLCGHFLALAQGFAEWYSFPPGQQSVQHIFMLIWADREDDTVFSGAQALERTLGLPQGTVFLIDWVEEPQDVPQVPAIDVHRARDLVWQLVKRAETAELAVALATIEAVWTNNEAVAWAKPALYHRFLLPVVRDYGFFIQEPTAQRTVEVSLHKAMVALQSFTYDAEVNGLSWRLEKALHLAPGTLLQVTPETTGGTKFPKFNSEAYLNKVHWWERMNVDAAYHEQGEGMIIPPEAPLPGPGPVLLLLLGHGHFNSRQRFMEGEIADLLQQEDIRKRMWIIIPKPDTRTGMAYWKGKRFEKDWSEDAVWLFFTEMLRKLGPEKVDPSRLYITGVSQGGAGVWHVCMKYGRHFAAAMPSGGASEWPRETWPRGGEPDPEAIKELRQVPFRAMHVDCDNHAPPPRKDIEYLTHGIEERSCEIQAFGDNMVKKFPIQIRKWFWKDSGEAFIELWWVIGPLDDGRNLGAWADDRHLVWIRSWANPYWGVASFFMENVCPKERQWKFDDPPIKVDTSEFKADLDRWGYFDPPEKDLFVIRDNADVEALVEAFRRDAYKAARYLRESQEAKVSITVERATEIERMEFRAVKDRPYDRIAVMWLKPHVNDVLALKMVAAERWFQDIHKFDTFGVCFRPPPKPGTNTAEPLALDTALTEEHAALEHCEEKVPRQSPDAAEFTVWLLLRHHVDYEKDCYCRTAQTVQKGSMDVAAMKKVLVPMLWEKSIIDSEDPKSFGLCLASRSAEGPENKIPGRLPLADNTMITVEHQILEVCKPGLAIELIIDPASGMKKDYSLELGATVWALRFMLADGKEDKARRMAVGLPPKKKTDKPVPLEDDVILSKVHAKLYLWTNVLPKAKAAPGR